jgi:hypothetical protein
MIRTEWTFLHSFALEFESESDLRETARRLLTVHRVTGEIGSRRLKDGRWRLDVLSEQELAEGLLDALKGRLVSAPADVAGA